MRFRRTLAIAAATVVLAGAVSGTAVANQAGATEGCTPGFWKNHTDWKSYDDGTRPTSDDNYPTTTLSVMLRTSGGTAYAFPSVYGDLGSTTMLDALNGGGGPGVTGAATILMRAGTAAYLNSDAALDYPYRRYTVGPTGLQPLRTLIVNALESQNRAKILALATQLDEANNLGCPLS